MRSRAVLAAAALAAFCMLLLFAVCEEAESQGPRSENVKINIIATAEVTGEIEECG